MQRRRAVEKAQSASDKPMRSGLGRGRHHQRPSTKIPYGAATLLVKCQAWVSRGLFSSHWPGEAGRG